MFFVAILLSSKYKSYLFWQGYWRLAKGKAAFCLFLSLIWLIRFNGHASCSKEATFFCSRFCFALIVVNYRGQFDPVCVMTRNEKPCHRQCYLGNSQRKYLRHLFGSLCERKCAHTTCINVVLWQGVEEMGKNLKFIVHYPF